MSDLYLRAHTEVIAGGPSDAERYRDRTPTERKDKWPRFVVVWDTETRVDLKQELTFGFYRVLELTSDSYQLIEEGAFYADNPKRERAVLESFTQNVDPDLKTFPPRFPLYSRTDFVKKVFYSRARRGAMITGFNLPWDLARIALKWPEGNRGEWSLQLFENTDGSENPLYPRVIVTPIDSKKSFIRFWYEWTPKRKDKKKAFKRSQINEACFLDLRTLLWSLYNKSFSLKRACDEEKGPFKGQGLPQKDDDPPSGKVTITDLKHCRNDVRCTAALLNAAKKEFDLHTDLSLLPDEAYSPASWAKNYLKSMGIATPEKKFKVPPDILGAAMEGYSGGRAETMTRLNEVPIVPVDYTSQYPSVCARLELFQILTAKNLKFKTVTKEVRHLLKELARTPDDCFEPNAWKEFVGFALVQPNDDVILPVRSNYNGITANIANNFLKHTDAIWQPIPDIVGSVIRTRKVPRILKAIRMIPVGKQTGMKPISLRDIVRIDPGKDDLFRSVIQQRKLHEDDPGLYYWLKIFANSIYGFFVETNLEYTPENKPVRVCVYSGQESYVPERFYGIEESHGGWYAPYIASLITSGGRLLLAMLEKCVIDEGGVWAWADTHALAIVASEHGGPISIKSSEHGRLVNRRIEALPWAQVQAIAERFEALNPYDRKLVPSLGLLNLTDDNFVDGKQRQLLGMSISAKRYAIYERHGSEIAIINPKAHGLGYLYPPCDSPEGWDDDHDAPKWIYDIWLWIVQKVLGLKAQEPEWFDRPQMMRLAVTTVNVLKRCHNWRGFRPFNFFLAPMVSPIAGYPANVDPDHFALAAPMESDQTKWIRSKCINIADSEDRRKYTITTDPMDRVQTAIGIAFISDFRSLAHRYLHHPEFKALAPDGTPCEGDTRGLLQRAHIVIDKVHRISKECDRRWEDGEDADAVEFEPPNYDCDKPKDYAVAREQLIRKIKKIGFPQLVRAGYSRYMLRRICRREPVRNLALQEYERIINIYKNGNVNR